MRLKNFLQSRLVISVVLLTTAVLVLWALLAVEDLLFDDGMQALKVGDGATGVGYLRPLATIGDFRAANILAEVYIHGDGLHRDHSEALYWLGRTYKPEDLLEKLLETGEGFQNGAPFFGPRDVHEAAFWYCAAKSRGSAAAHSKLESLGLPSGTEC